LPSDAADPDGIDIGGIPSATVSLGVMRAVNAITMPGPASATDFQLESAGVLPSMNWVVVPFDPPQPGENPSLTVTPASGNKFHQLRKPWPRIGLPWTRLLPEYVPLGLYRMRWG